LLYVPAAVRLSKKFNAEKGGELDQKRGVNDKQTRRRVIHCAKCRHESPDPLALFIVDGDVSQLGHWNGGKHGRGNTLCAGWSNPAGGMRRLSGHPLACAFGTALFSRLGL
jgi:hypothetical protein